MKRFFCVFISLLFILSLCGCSAKKEYADDVSCSTLYEEISEELDDGNQYLEFNSIHMETYFPNTDEYDDCYTVYSADVNDINEIGIFHSDGEYVAGIFESCQTYIQDMRENSRAFISSYAPDQLPRLDAARVERFGNYVVYLILPEELSEEVIDKIEDILSKD